MPCPLPDKRLEGSGTEVDAPLDPACPGAVMGEKERPRIGEAFRVRALKQPRVSPGNSPRPT